MKSVSEYCFAEFARQDELLRGAVIVAIARQDGLLRGM
jgi:hypothetical protein